MADIFIPNPLRKYTNGQRVVETRGATLREMLDALERDYPGFTFRIVNEQGQLREHIHLFINQRVAPDLSARIEAGDEIRIIFAISGGAPRNDGNSSRRFSCTVYNWKKSCGNGEMNYRRLGQADSLTRRD